MFDLIVLHGEFSIFTVRGNFWYQIYRNRRKKVLCSRLSLISITLTISITRSARVLVGCKPIINRVSLSFLECIIIYNILTGDTRKIFVSNIIKTVDESHSARVLIGCKPINNIILLLVCYTLCNVMHYDKLGPVTELLRRLRLLPDPNRPPRRCLRGIGQSCPPCPCPILLGGAQSTACSHSAESLFVV